MGTPFISLQEPAKLDSWVRGRPSGAQPEPPAVPKVFRDAMEVREAVFVREQGVPLGHELDADDARSCHWAVYASVNQTTEPEARDPGTGEVVRPRRSVTRSLPVGTLRVVPFPHPPHPRDGGRYVDNVLQQEQEQEQEQPPPPSQVDGASAAAAAASTTTESGDARETTAPTTLAPSSQSAASSSSSPPSEEEERRQTSALPFGIDRATTYHDGREPYVKVGRLAVIPEFRGHRIAGQLWRAARQWLEEHPAYFNPSVAELGMDRLRAGAPSEIPQWGGLVICHAQESVVKVWERYGFRVDEGMGRWYEEGIPHVGMAMRLNIKKKNPTI